MLMPQPRSSMTISTAAPRLNNRGSSTPKRYAPMARANWGIAMRESDPERSQLRNTLRSVGVVMAIVWLLVAFAVAVAALTRADATEDHPNPRRMLHAGCTAEQILAAAMDVIPEPGTDAKAMR